MKSKSIAVLFSVIAAVACAACADDSPNTGNVQRLDYTESIAAIANPDQGFYRPVYVKFLQGGATYNKNIINDATQLYHLRCDISEFSAAVNGGSDLPLSQAATDGLDDLLSYLKENDKNAVVRFAYDPGYNGSANKEPALDVILRHVEQVSVVLDRYRNTVTAVEAGLIGPWGEMHTSSAANPTCINAIADAFLTNTSDIAISLRTPKMIYDYLGVSADEAAELTIAPDEKAYRLGLYNDGYLGSDSDLGTYSNRERDTNFLSRQTSHLPFGGEVTIPDSPLHDIEACLPEMNKLNLSYLNIEWDNRVIAKWKSASYTSACGNDAHYYGETAFAYIENHLGYRYVLKKSVFAYSDADDRLDIELTLRNVGFGNLNKKKHAVLLFVDESGSAVYSQEADSFFGETELRYTAAPPLRNGKYDVYLRLYGEDWRDQPLYCIRFANAGLWNAELKANKIGSVEYGGRSDG